MTGSQESPAPPAAAPENAGCIRIEPGAVPPAVYAALQTGTVLAPADVGVVSVSGSGAVLCLQGLLTNDIEKPGDGAFVYAALLTAKGMIVVDGWAARHGTTVTYTVDTALRERTLALFRHAIPPRLARVTDETPVVAVLRLAGPRSLAVAEAAGLAPPGAAGLRVPGSDPPGGEVARASDGAPFALQITVPSAEAQGVVNRLRAAGATLTDATALECARILAGWPRVGAEVDEKTIPQEVRFDALGGVSYTKGCYTGQETVSRLHFRGHANRHLQGLLFDAEPVAGNTAVRRADREVGRVTSVAWVSAGEAARGRWIGLAVLRREVEPSAVVHAAGRDARVVELPFVQPVPVTTS